MKRILTRIIPWLITALALWYAFHDVEWSVLLSHLGDIHLGWALLAIALTITSYVLRSARWQLLFPRPVLSFAQAYRVLIMGFFMNNVLPARAGELVRAHLGAKTAGLTRTQVLATVVAERLVDGLVLSFFFVIFAVGLGDSGIGTGLLWVAVAFGAVGLGILGVLILRERIITFAGRFLTRIDNKASRYTFDRLQLFLGGLTPLTHRARAPHIALWSIVIWSIELGVYASVAFAYNVPLSLAQSVLFMVAVNFSSLIPAAPGGIGVIEAVGSKVLQSVGIQQELALTMVVTQHFIQYAMVGIPGIFLLLTWKESRRHISDLHDEQLHEPA